VISWPLKWRCRLPRLAISVSGAYQLPMASTYYNLVSCPAVVFVRDGTAWLVCRCEGLEDLLRLEVSDA
jgi:hypothetical protein